MKVIAILTALLALSACVDSGGSVSRNIVDNGLSCPGSPHMGTVANLPVRCGPQTVSPYSFQ